MALSEDLFKWEMLTNKYKRFEGLGLNHVCNLPIKERLIYWKEKAIFYEGLTFLHEGELNISLALARATAALAWGVAFGAYQRVFIQKLHITYYQHQEKMRAL